MTDTKKKSFDWTSPFATTNVLIYVVWCLTAGVIAITVRIITSIILAITNILLRVRIVRW